MSIIQQLRERARQGMNQNEEMTAVSEMNARPKYVGEDAVVRQAKEAMRKGSNSPLQYSNMPSNGDASTRGQVVEIPSGDLGLASRYANPQKSMSLREQVQAGLISPADAYRMEQEQMQYGEGMRPMRGNW